jgi:hypothetical protein
MVPHGAGVGVYVRGALSGLRPDARKSKHGLKTIFPNRLGRRSTVEPGPTGGSLNRSVLGLSDRLYRGDWLAMVASGGPKSRRRIVF